MRVFVSSTFRDMQAERDALVKRVFPLLRRACEARSVAWGEVDLRWGITSEDVAEGGVLPICLAEIDACRPFFLCILGERYGYVPEVPLGAGLIEQEPWLADATEASVTELEILHGVLNNPAMAGRALFYFRDPGFVESIADTEARRDFAAESDTARARLTELKARIRASGRPVRDGFRDAETLADLVRDDLLGLLDASYPEDDVPSAETAEAEARQRFVATRAAHFAGRQDALDRLGAAIAGGSVHVLAGAAGSGKTAILARLVERGVTVAPPALPAPPPPVLSSPVPPPPRPGWFARLFRRQPAEPPPEPPLVFDLAPAAAPDTPPLPHRFLDIWVGGTTGTDRLVPMLRQLIERLQAAGAPPVAIPQEIERLAACFADSLLLAARRGPITVVIDGADCLADGDGGPDLLWLPRELPPGAAIIVSTRPGRTLDAARDRKVGILKLPPLETPDRRALAGTYLQYFRKALSAERMDRLVAASGAGNPRFLRIVLDRLRVFGQHEALDEAIAGWTSAEELPALQSRALAELEHDHGLDLVAEVFALLAAARNGLMEAEIRDLALGGGLRMSVLSPLLVNAAGFIERSESRLTLTDTSLGAAVLTPLRPRRGRARCPAPALGDLSPDSRHPAPGRGAAMAARARRGPCSAAAGARQCRADRRPGLAGPAGRGAGRLEAGGGCRPWLHDRNLPRHHRARGGDARACGPRGAAADDARLSRGRAGAADAPCRQRTSPRRSSARGLGGYPAGELHRKHAGR
jgi:hypothetical protein